MTRRLAVVALLAACLFSSAARSGEWRVSPIRLELGRQARSGVVTVTNDSPERLQLQVRATEWTQDSEGKDRYEETADLVYFPKMMIFEKSEERVLRAGVRVPAAGREKTYRLFLEEIPGPRKDEGVNVAIAVRFGVPVFVRPVKEEPAGEVAGVTMSQGRVEATVRNLGNVHFVIHAVTVKGKNARGEEIFSRELSGWYLLTGASMRYATEIPPDVCPAAAAIHIEVRTDKFPLAGQLDADKAMCPGS